MRISDWSSDVCSSDLPINSAPQHHFVAGAAIRALNQWLVDGTAPRSAPRIQINAAGDGIARDAHGNALGGIRTPYVNVPTPVLSGETARTQRDAATRLLVGNTQPFDAAPLASLYPDRPPYLPPPPPPPPHAAPTPPPPTPPPT